METNQKSKTSNYRSSVSLKVKAISITDNNDGTFYIELPAREISKEEHAMLQNMFPTLLEQAYKLHAKEGLLNALTD